ncbi:MAG TPA: GNAT family N-acetyltransferase [Thermoanaerobaculia bacterium]|nr:GNAT family N-acetyltransferase [Thermoanaerobaculia bacterium]
MSSSSAGDRVAVTRDAITCRPGTDDDYDFQRLLYHDARAEEMQNFPFDDAQKRAFLDWQFDCQWKHYREHYPTCDWRIIMRDGQAIGRLLIDRWADQIRIVDIALVSAARGSGIGSMLMQEILDEGRAAGKPVTIHVEVFNPAQRLYQRLGFQQVDSSGAYHLMQWSPVR